MDKPQFREWFRYHCARFTGIRHWLDKITKGIEAPSEEDVLKAWRGVLREVDLEAAKAASNAMLAGTVEEPKGFDRHPAAIRRACGGRADKREMPGDRMRYDADGNQTFECLTCRDTGWVRCWHPDTVAEIARDGFVNKRLYTCVYRCTCHAGDLRFQYRDSPRFDANRALPSNGVLHDREEQQRLLDWLAKREPVRPAHYETLFDETVESQAEMEF